MGTAQRQLPQAELSAWIWCSSCHQTNHRLVLKPLRPTHRRRSDIQDRCGWGWLLLSALQWASPQGPPFMIVCVQAPPVGTPATWVGSGPQDLI